MVLFDILLSKVSCVCIFGICKRVNPVTSYADHRSEGSLRILSFKKVNKVPLVLKHRLTRTLVSTRSLFLGTALLVISRHNCVISDSQITDTRNQTHSIDISL